MVSCTRACICYYHNSCIDNKSIGNNVISEKNKNGIQVCPNQVKDHVADKYIDSISVNVRAAAGISTVQGIV